MDPELTPVYPEPNEVRAGRWPIVLKQWKFQNARTNQKFGGNTNEGKVSSFLNMADGNDVIPRVVGHTLMVEDRDVPPGYKYCLLAEPGLWVSISQLRMSTWDTGHLFMDSNISPG